MHTGDCVGIIAVSDVHLGYMSRDKTQSLSNRDDFNRFLDNVLDADDIDKFVICGDLLDMWRRDISGVVVENAETLHKLHMLTSKMDVYYIVGNHDYHMHELRNFKYQFEISKEKILQEGGKTYHFKHGYDFDPLMNEVYFNALCYSNDELEDIATRAYEVWIKWREWKDVLLALFKKEKIQEHLRKMATPVEIRVTLADRDKINLRACRAVKEGEILVFGHTHKPFINEKENVVNLGSWVKDAQIQNTYLEIKNGGMALKKFQSGEITERLRC